MYLQIGEDILIDSPGDRPKLAVIQAAGSAPFADFMKSPDAAHFPVVERPWKWFS